MMNKAPALTFVLFLICFVAFNCSDRGPSPGIMVDASRAGPGLSFKDAPLVRPFATGVMLHNAYPAFTKDEFEDGRGRGVVLFDPARQEQVMVVGADESEGGPWNVRCLAYQHGKDGPRLWVGTQFDGVYAIGLPQGSVDEHFTVESTGILGRALSLDENKLTFEPIAPLRADEISNLKSRVSTGLYMRLNTEVFQIKKIDWPRIFVYTYQSHDLEHSGRAGDGLGRVVIVTGLADNTVNDIMVDGDTVWFATGRSGDKGLAGGLVSYRNKTFLPRYPDAVFNKRHRFNWHRSNACLAVGKHAGRVWSGWGEIRGLKLWGGVSGNLLNFSGDGMDPDEWRDFTRPIGVKADGFAPVLHTSVPALAEVELGRGSTLEQCMAAGTFSINNANRGMGYPGRHAWGGGGLRVICDWKLTALVAKSFGEDGSVLPGSPPSNAVLALDAGKVAETGEVFAFAGTDAGLYIVELTSRKRDYFYEPPKNPLPLIQIGSDYLAGVKRTGEVLHGLTVGSKSWPPCLPDLMVQDIHIDGELSADTTSTIWVGTYRGLARYSGPVLKDALSDCRRWKNYPSVISAPVSAIEEVVINNRKLLALGTGYRWKTPGQGGALKRVVSAASTFSQRPLTHVRVHYSTLYENPQESLLFPDSGAMNLYTESFHAKTCAIDQPGCLAADTALNWSHLDEMVDGIVTEDLTPTFCIATFPVLIYQDFVDEKNSSCRPPDPEKPECAPSQTEWDWTRWENLTFAIVDHFYQRYGRERVSRWSLEVGNEPAIHWLWPWKESWAQDYAIMFQHTDSAVKACNKWWDEKETDNKGVYIRIAGPAWHGDPNLPDERFKNLLDELSSRGLFPDLLTTHIYPFVSTDMTPWYNKTLEIVKNTDHKAPIAITEYGMVMAQGHDGVGTSAASELPAISLLRSLHGLYQSESPPEMMYFTDIQSMAAGARSNWPGLVGYPGSRDAAPLPIFNLMTLAAQAGDLPLHVKSQGDINAFARFEPRTGKIMVFAYHTKLEKPWKKTINYEKRGEIKVELKIKGLRDSFYRCREFKIDGSHANFLTAHWRAGSPDQPSESQTKKIIDDSFLAALQGDEKFLPEALKGDSVILKISMEEESIYVAELTPPPVIAVSGSTINGLSIKVAGGGDVAIAWTSVGTSYQRIFKVEQRLWASEEKIKFHPQTMDSVSDREGGTHNVYERARGGIRYQYHGPVTSTSSFRNVGSAHLVSSYAPFPAGSPRNPVVAVDGNGDVHIAWIEKEPEALGIKGREAIVYSYLRR